MSREIIRCSWSKKSSIYIKYHDEEWGVPIYDDQKIFEFLLLETFQAGLSWITILNKRKNFRKAFSNFDYQKIANYSNKKLEELEQDSSIIRNKLKIKAAKTNANAFIEVQKEFGTLISTRKKQLDKPLIKIEELKETNSAQLQGSLDQGNPF